mgnify:CR=1 FL=1
MMQTGWWIAAAVLVVGMLAQAKPAGFYIERLPAGSDVTLPVPATTFVPLTQRVMLTSTDMPQSISLKAVSTGGGRVLPIQVSIFDRNSDRVKYIDLRPGQPFLYKFQNLSSIYVIPKMPKGQSGRTVAHLKLQIESDKPLGIAR